jgi:plasmid stabilization system protein ParE
MARRKILWDKQATRYFLKAIEYIGKDSPKNALSVRESILSAIDNLAIHPERHPPDKFKLNNKDDYRAFEMHRLRIAYLVKDDNIIIITRVRHTSQEPLGY